VIDDANTLGEAIAPESSGLVHVYPVHHDEPAHDTGHGLACWCEPYRLHDEPRVIVHRRTQ